MRSSKALLLVITLLFNVALWSTTDRLISRFERARPKLLDAEKYYAKGNLEKAEKSLKVCLKRMPEYSDAHYLKSKIKLKQKKYDEALASAKAAVDNYKYRYIIYRYFSDKKNNPGVGRFSESRTGGDSELIVSSDERRLREEKKLRIKNIEAKYYFQYGNVYFSMRKYSDAHKKYVEAIKINPKYGDAYNNMANLYWMSKQYQQALDYLNKARDNGAKINPKFESALKKMLNK